MGRGPSAYVRCICCAGDHLVDAIIYGRASGNCPTRGVQSIFYEIYSDYNLVNQQRERKKKRA